MAVERGLTPLVGRERELATLRERFREVKAGRGQVVGIAGEAGMGKSRLVLEFRRALAQAGEAVTWLEGHCISFGQASPFLPLIEQLRENFQIDELDGEPEIIAKVEQGMRRMGELEAHIPAIRYLLSVDPGDPALTAMEGTARRRHLFAALRALSLRGAQLRPLVLVVEDLHWIDTSSEEFLTFLLDAVAGVPLLLLVTYRIGYTPPFGSRSFYTTLTLHSFSEAETLAMAGHVLGTAQFPAELQTALMDKAEGVPLFIEEVTKTLLDLGVLQREDGAYRLVKSLSEVQRPRHHPGDHYGPPGPSRGGRETHRAAGLGDRSAIPGAAPGARRRVERSPRRAAARVAGPGDHLRAGARAGARLHLQARRDPGCRLQSLLMQRRKALHRAVGEAIEELYQDRLEEHYAELAHHFTQGEVWDKALAYCRQAGEQGPGAVGLPRGRGVLRAGAQRPAASAGAARHARAGHRSPARPALSALAARATSGVSWPICARLRPSPRPSTTRGGWDRSLAFWPSISASWARMTRPSPPPSAPSRSPRPAGTSSCTRWRTRDLGLAYQAQGDYRQAIDCLGQTVASFEGARRRERFGQVILPAVISRAYLAWCHAELGTFAEGRTLGDEGLQIAEAVDHPASLMIGLLGDRSPVAPPRRPAQGTPPARTRRGHLSARSTCRSIFPG